MQNKATTSLISGGAGFAIEQYDSSKPGEIGVVYVDGERELYWNGSAYQEFGDASEGGGDGDVEVGYLNLPFFASTVSGRTAYEQATRGKNAWIKIQSSGDDFIGHLHYAQVTVNPEDSNTALFASDFGAFILAYNAEIFGANVQWLTNIKASDIKLDESSIQSLEAGESVSFNNYPFYNVGSVISTSLEGYETCVPDIVTTVRPEGAIGEYRWTGRVVSSSSVLYTLVSEPQSYQASNVLTPCISHMPVYFHVTKAQNNYWFAQTESDVIQIESPTLRLLYQDDEHITVYTDNATMKYLLSRPVPEHKIFFMDTTTQLGRVFDGSVGVGGDVTNNYEYATPFGLFTLHYPTDAELVENPDAVCTITAWNMNFGGSADSSEGSEEPIIIPDYRPINLTFAADDLLATYYINEYDLFDRSTKVGFAALGALVSGLTFDVGFDYVAAITTDKVLITIQRVTDSLYYLRFQHKSFDWKLRLDESLNVWGTELADCEAVTGGVRYFLAPYSVYYFDQKTENTQYVYQDDFGAWSNLPTYDNTTNVTPYVVDYYGCTYCLEYTSDAQTGDSITNIHLLSLSLIPANSLGCHFFLPANVFAHVMPCTEHDGSYTISRTNWETIYYAQPK